MGDRPSRAAGRPGRVGRPPRHTDAEVRALMLDAAAELARSQGGLTVSLEHLSYEQVIRRAGVARSAAYRLWRYKEDFHFELIAHLAGVGKIMSTQDHGTIAEAVAVLRAGAGSMDTEEGRWHLLTEIARRVLWYNHCVAKESYEWRSYVTISAAIVGNPFVFKGLSEVIDPAGNFAALMEPFLGAMLGLLGRRLIDGVSLHVYSAIAVCMGEGLMLRSHTFADVVETPAQMDVAGSMEEWSLPGLGMLAITRALTEPVPDFDPEQAKAELIGVLAQLTAEPPAPVPEQLAALSQGAPQSPGGPGRRTGRPPHQDDDQVRMAMLEAAEQLVREEGGLTVSLQHLSYEVVIRRAGVARSAAYALWPYKQDFNLAFVAHLLSSGNNTVNPPDHGGTDAATAAVVARLDDLETEEGRQRILAEVIRVAALANFRSSRDAYEWRTFLALSAAAISDPEVRQVISDKLGTASDFTQRLGPYFEDMSILLGFRFRSGMTASRFAVLTTSLTEGQLLRSISTPVTIEQPFVMDTGDGPVEWNQPALGFLALVRGLTEPDPGYDPATAMETYAARAAARDADAADGGEADRANPAEVFPRP